MTRPRVRPSILLALVLLAQSVGSARADIAISGFFSQQFEVRDGGDEAGSDASLRAVTDLGITFRGVTPRTQWSLSPGVRGLLSTGDGEEPSLTPRLSGALSHGGATTSLTGSISVIPDFTDETQFEDTGRTEQNTLQITTSARIGLSHSLSPRDTLTLGLSGVNRDFLGDVETLSASRSITLDSGWRRALTPLTAATASPSLRFFFSEAETGSEGVTLSLPLGVDTRLTPATTFVASLGPSLTRSEREGESAKTDPGLTGGATLNWRDEDTTAVVGLNQSVDQNADGGLENRASFRVGVSQRLTPRSTVGFDATAGLQTSFGGETREGGDRRTLSLSPRYSYALSEDWSVDVNYRLRASDDDDGTDYTNSVFLRFSRGLSLLP